MKEVRHFERALKAIETQERFRTGEIQVFSWGNIKDLFLGCVSIGVLAKQNKTEAFGEWVANNHLDLALAIYERRHKYD